MLFGLLVLISSNMHRGFHMYSSNLEAWVEGAHYPPHQDIASSLWQPTNPFDLHILYLHLFDLQVPIPPFIWCKGRGAFCSKLVVASFRPAPVCVQFSFTPLFVSLRPALLKKLDAGQCAHFSWTIDSRDPIGSKIIYLETYRAPYEAL